MLRLVAPARIAVIASLAMLFIAAAGAEPPGHSMLPEVSGLVRHAVISVNSARRSTLRNAGLITNIVNAFPPDVRFDIITNDRAAFTVAGRGNGERIRFIEVPEKNPITIWPQDPFLVLADPGGDTRLLKPVAFARSGDDLLAGLISRETGYPVEVSDLHFEGGNIVSDGDNILIGANSIRHNALLSGISDQAVVKRFEKELGRGVLVVGPYPQPVAHIDMVLTPLGEGRLLVADGSWGAEIVERLLESSAETVREFERETGRNFFGSPEISEIAVNGGEVLAPPALDGKTEEMITLSRQLAPVLDGIAEGFRRFGYTVERMPFLFGGPEALISEETESGQLAAYPMLTYNNVIIENGGEGAHVYLPHYGLEAMDRAASKAWAALGFEVHPVRGFATSAMYGGALRCTVKVLGRDSSGVSE